MFRGDSRIKRLNPLINRCDLNNEELDVRKFRLELWTLELERRMKKIIKNYKKIILQKIIAKLIKIF